MGERQILQSYCNSCDAERLRALPSFFICKIYNIQSRPGAIIYFLNPLDISVPICYNKYIKKRGIRIMTYENIKEIYQDIIDLWGEDLGGQIAVAIRTAPHVDITYQDFMCNHC